MINSLRSELVKLMRLRAVLGYAGAAIGFTSLLTVVSIMNSGDGGGDGPASRASVTPEQLAEPGGYLAGFEAANNFLGIIALALFASSVAAEFSTGTIRALLVVDARRRSLLAGKVIGLAAFLVATLAFAAGVGSAVAFALAGNEGIATDAWFTMNGLIEGVAIWSSVSLAVIVWGLFGALLAMVSRSAAISIAAGVAYFLIGEHLILQALWPSIADWLPAGLLTALAEGGTSSVSFSTAALMSGLYAAVAYGVTAIIFERRDVTD